MLEGCRRAGVVSSAGAVGLIRLLPEPGALYGAADPFDPAADLDADAQSTSSDLDSP